MKQKDDFFQLSQSLMDKTVTKEELLNRVKQDFELIPFLLKGVDHPKAAVRYGCSNVLLELSEEHPEPLYPHFDFFVNLLDSKYRILKWTALAIIANLARVDADKRFDAVFGKYYSFLDDDYMITVANVVGNSGKIALAKPYLISEVTEELLKVQNLSISPHLTEECRRVVSQHAIKVFDQFFDRIDQKERVLSFVESCVGSSRKALHVAAEKFLKKWG